MSNSNPPDPVGETTDDGHRSDEHLADVADGCGCVEVWEHLSEQQATD